jgi:hypothetical protein
MQLACGNALFAAHGSGVVGFSPASSSRVAIRNGRFTSTPDIVSRPGRHPLSAKGGLSAHAN